jgi:hypothetical protein
MPWRGSNTPQGTGDGHAETPGWGSDRVTWLGCAAMNVYRKLTTTAAAALLATALSAGPVLAVEDEPAPAPAEDEGGRVVLVEEPRDVFALLMWGGLLAAGALGLVNARRQLKGERPQATGEFRWR